MAADQPTTQREVEVPAGAIALAGDLTLPPRASGVVLFAHGSGSGRLSPRNRQVAAVLNEAGLGTLLFDLLSEDEAARRTNVFDIPLLGERLADATMWVLDQEDLRSLRIGYFGASTGGAAALRAAVPLREHVFAIVSRGGRPDLAGEALPLVTAPTLLIVGGEDQVVLELNREARERMRCPTELIVIPGATHLFEEPGALEQVAEHAARWFQRHLGEKPES
jgi:putative phosphoribosyl transferase